MKPKYTKTQDLIRKAGGDVRIIGGVRTYIDKTELDVELLVKLAVEECVKICLAQPDPQNLNYKPSERIAEIIALEMGLPRS